MISAFLPALYQPPAPWFPGGSTSVDDVFTHALMPNMSGDKGFLPGSVGAERRKDTDMQNIFTPALMDEAAGSKHLPGPTSMARDDMDDAARPLHDCPNWLDERLRGTPAFYPHALIAFPHWRGLVHRPFPAEGFLMGDSGGFTVMTSGVDIDPLSVLQWQIRERCTAGMILDVPPVDQHGTRQFDEGLLRTCKHVQRVRSVYLKHRKEGGPFRWWGVVHGWELPELEHWWQSVSSKYDFSQDGEGWGFKPRPTITAVTTATCLHFIKNHDAIRRAHFLMTTGADAVLTLLALGEEAGLEFVSYDSSTPTRNATNRLLCHINSDGLGWDAKQERKAERQERDFMRDTCECASCLGMRGELQVWPDLIPADGSWGPYWVFRFAYHNLLCMIKVFDNIRKLCENANDGREALMAGMGSKKAFTVLKAFEGQASVEGSRTGSLLDYL